MRAAIAAGAVSCVGFLLTAGIRFRPLADARNIRSLEIQVASALRPHADVANRPVAEVQWDNDNAGMHSMTAYERRASLNVEQLHRLRAQLVDEVERYRTAIRGYSPDKMAQYGTPYLEKLEARVADVDALIGMRAQVR